MARCWWDVLVQRHEFSILMLPVGSPVFDSYMHENNFLGLLLVWDVHSVVSAETVNEEIVSDCACDIAS
jgi:hypothetical protein